MNESLIHVSGVTKVYQQATRQVFALNDVSLMVKSGEIFALLGVNGAGKTTLSNILATLSAPTSGQVFYNNVSVYNDIYTYRLDLGYCPQKPNLDALLSVEDNLKFAGRYFLMQEAEITERVEYLMKFLQLEEYRHTMIDQLSGGYRQRVSIARALINKPRIVIFDEPTVALDPHIRRAIWQIIQELKSLGITIILTTHYLDEAEFLADRVCILNKGKILLIDTPAKLKEEHKLDSLEDVFIKLIDQE